MSIVSANSERVLGVNGVALRAPPQGFLPPRGIVHAGGSAVALLAAHGRSVAVCAGNDDSAPWHEVALDGELEGRIITPLGPFRLAVGCIHRRSSDGTAAVTGASSAAAVQQDALTDICLVDVVHPAVERFALPTGGTAHVVGFAPLAPATLLCLFANGGAAVWTPQCAEPFDDHDKLGDLVSCGLVWWNAAVTVTTSQPVALHAVALARPPGGNGPAKVQVVGIGSNGDLVQRDDHMPDALRSVADALSQTAAAMTGVAPRVAAEVTRSGEARELVFADGQQQGGSSPRIALSGSTATVDDGVVAAVASAWSELESCPICLDDLEIGAGDAVALDCGHVLHQDCLAGCVARAEDYLGKGHRIVFNLSNCPQGCGRLVRHPCFPASARVASRYAQVISDVRRRAARDYPGHAAEEVLGNYLHYVCGTCGSVYWGGNKDCIEMMSGETDVDPATLQCADCRNSSVAPCTAHGSEFLFHKCSYCCNVATDFSVGRLWLCDACVKEKRKTPVWSTGSNGSSAGCVGAADCPFGGCHPATNEKPLGCLLCFLDSGRVEQSKMRQPPAE